FDALNASLDPTSNQIKTWTEAAQQMGEQVKANVTDWKDTASRLGLATDKELTAAARKGITAMLGIGEAAEPLRGTEAVTKQAQIQFEAFKPALLALGYTAAEVADMAAKYTAKLVKTRDDAVALTQRQGSAAIEALVNPGAKTPVLDRLEGLGLDRKNSVIVGVAAAIDSVEQAASRGTLTIEDERRALATLNAQFAAGYLTADQYTTSVGYLTQAWTDSAAAAERAAQRVAYTADLNSRMHAAVGNARGSGLLALDQQQAVELAQARANGYDTAQLAQVQAAERGQKAFELAQADVLAAYDQQISAQQDLITSLQEGAVAAAAVARQFRQAYNALALDENSPLSAYERLMEARRQFEEAASTATSGTATDTEKTAAQTLLQQLGPTLVQLAQAYFANSNRDDYDRVRSVFDRLGTTSTDSADTADRQLQAANETLKELQRSRSDAARFGERQFGAISGLKDVMDQSYAIWQAALAPLQRLTGTTPGTSQPTTVNSSRYAAPAAVQADWDSLSAGQQTAVVRGIGWQGKVDEALNVWLATTSGKSGAFESAVSTTAEKRRRLLAFSNSDIEAAFGHFADIQAARSADPGFNLAQWFRDFGMDEVLSGSRRIPGFARGTMETPPGAVWVGERGPELLWQGGGAAVASSADSVRIAAMYQSAANDRLPVNYAAFGPRQSAAQQMDITPLLYRIEALTKEVQHLRAERSRDAIGQAAIAEQNLAVNARGHQQTAAALNRQKLMQRAA
ncbi:MAG: phage tail tape measure protein, partial [Alphaproteobacteria bacterium]